MVNTILQGVQEISNEINVKVAQGGEDIDHVDTQVEEAEELTRAAGEDLKSAAILKYKGKKLEFGLIGGAIGATVGGLVGLGIGAGVGGALGVSVGAGIGKAVEKVGVKKINTIEFQTPEQAA